jgi:predicted nicotinamide N-methyase
MNCDDDVCYDVMMNRGTFLRKLRQMAEEDDAHRDNNTNDCGDSDVLSYQSYLAVHAVYDDYKHVNYNKIDFGIVGGSPLVIEQDRTVGKGGFVWDSGYILAEHVTREMDWQIGNPSVVELGSGTGVTGLFVARQVPDAKVHLTDLPELLPLLEKNSNDSLNVTAGVLEWGRNSSGQYDVILGADVVASIYDSSALAKTIYDLSHEQTRVYLACEDRLAGSIETFESHMKNMFEHVERKKSNSANNNPKVWILQIHGKRQNQ